VSQIRVGVDEVVRKVEGFHITQDNGSDSWRSGFLSELGGGDPQF
jgi:hypothetical protein